jgi:hypothetical protein
LIFTLLKIFFFSIPPVLTFFWLLVPAMLDVLNCFWFYKMMKGLIKALQVNIQSLNKYFTNFKIITDEGQA